MLNQIFEDLKVFFSKKMNKNTWNENVDNILGDLTGVYYDIKDKSNSLLLFSFNHILIWNNNKEWSSCQG